VQTSLKSIVATCLFVVSMASAPAAPLASAQVPGDWCQIVDPAALEPQSTGSNWTFGTKKLLFYRLRFPGETEDVLTAQQIQQVMQEANAAFQRISYGQFGLEWTLTPSLVLPHPPEWYGGGGHLALAADAQAAALSAGLNWQDFDLDIFQHRHLPGTIYSAIANIRGRGVWIVHEGQPGDSPHLVVHELGHNLGLPHANIHWTGNPHLAHPNAVAYGIYGSPPFPSNVGAFTNILRFDPNSSAGQPDLRTATLSVEYGDPFDIMGDDRIHRGFSAVYRRRLNWLTESNVATATTGGVFRVHSVDAEQLVAGRANALRIEHALTGRGTDRVTRRYWLQHHGALATNANLAGGIQLRWEPDDHFTQSQYVDTTPAKLELLRPESRLLHLGRTFTDSLANLHITPVSAGSQGNERWFDIEIRFGPFPSNRPPQLTLNASVPNTLAGVPVTFTALATDAAGDALHFFWDFGDGTYASGTNSVQHAFPGTIAGAVVRCEASDARGVTSRQLFIGVGPSPAGRIVGRVFDTQGNPITDAHVHNGRLANFPFDRPDFVTTDTDSMGVFTLVCPDARTNLPGAFAYGYRMVSPQPGFEVAVPMGTTRNLDFVLAPLPRISASLIPETATEGASNVVLSFNCDRPADQPLEVWFQLGGTATLDADYAGNVAMERVLIPAGTNTVTMSMSLLRDVEVEGDEELFVTAVAPRQEFREVVTGGMTNLVTFHHPGWELRSYRDNPAWFMTEPRYVVSAESAAALTIIDATPADIPRLAVFAGTMQPQEHPATAGHFLITRAGSTNQPLQVHLNLSGAASNGGDFEQVPDVIAMPAGATNLFVSILPFDDNLVEGDENVLLELTLAPELSYAIEYGLAEMFIKDSERVTHRLEFGEQFGGDKVLYVFGELNRSFVVETSTNLVHWHPWETNVILFNPTSVGIPPFWETSRFYKSYLLPP
jgi:hypothetical protein